MDRGIGQENVYRYGAALHEIEPLVGAVPFAASDSGKEQPQSARMRLSTRLTLGALPLCIRQKNKKCIEKIDRAYAPLCNPQVKIMGCVIRHMTGYIFMHHRRSKKYATH